MSDMGDPLDGLAIDDEDDPLADIVAPSWSATGAAHEESGAVDLDQRLKGQGLSQQPEGTRVRGRTLVLPEQSFQVDPTGQRPDIFQEEGEYTELRDVSPEGPGFGATVAGLGARMGSNLSDLPALGRRVGTEVAAGMLPQWAQVARGLAQPTREAASDPAATGMGTAQGFLAGNLDELRGRGAQLTTAEVQAGIPPWLAQAGNQAGAGALGLLPGGLGALGLPANVAVGGIRPEVIERAQQGETPSDAYEFERNQIRMADREMQERSPGAYGVGTVLGTAPQMLVPGGQSTWLGRVGMQGLAGFGMGGLRGFGQSEATDAEGLLADTATGAAVEGLGGAALTGAGELGGGIVRGVGNWLARRAPGLQRASTQAGLEARGIWGRDAMEAARQRPGGQEGLLRELDEMGAPLHAREMPEFIDRQLAEQGERIGNVVREMDESGARVGTESIINRLRGLAGEQDEMVMTGASPARALRQRAEALEQLPEQSLGFGQSHRQRRELDRLVNWQNPDPSIASLTGQRAEMRRALSDAMRDAAEGAGRGPEWTAANRGYSTAAELDDIARGYERRNVQGGMAGAQSRAAGFGRMVSGPGLVNRAQGAVEAIAGPAAMQELRYAWPGASYRGMQALIPQLRAAGPQGARFAATLEAASRRGSIALAAAHALLSQRDPEYRQAVEAAQNAAAQQEQPTEEPAQQQPTETGAQEGQ
jgi:hypothetical protein